MDVLISNKKIRHDTQFTFTMHMCTCCFEFLPQCANSSRKTRALCELRRKWNTQKNLKKVRECDYLCNLISLQCALFLFLWILLFQKFQYFFLISHWNSEEARTRVFFDTGTKTWKSRIFRFAHSFARETSSLQWLLMATIR